MDTWNLRLRTAREKRGLSKSELSRLVKVSAPTVTDWEAGVIKELKGVNLHKVCQTLRIAPDWLLYGKGEMESSATASYSTTPKSVTSYPILSPKVLQIAEALEEYCTDSQHQHFYEQIMSVARTNQEIIAFNERKRGSTT